MNLQEPPYQAEHKIPTSYLRETIVFREPITKIGHYSRAVVRNEGMMKLTDPKQLVAIASGEASTSYEQRNAIAKLGELKDTVSLDALTLLLDIDDRYLRRDVVKAIGNHGSDKAVLALIHCLSDSTENIRRDAASLLGTRNDGRAIIPLKTLTDDKGYAVRHAAVSALDLLEREGVTSIELGPTALERFSTTHPSPTNQQAATNKKSEPKKSPQTETPFQNTAGRADELNKLPQPKNLTSTDHPSPPPFVANKQSTKQPVKQWQPGNRTSQPETHSANRHSNAASNTPNDSELHLPTQPRNSESKPRPNSSAIVSDPAENPSDGSLQPKSEKQRNKLQPNHADQKQNRTASEEVPGDPVPARVNPDATTTSEDIDDEILLAEIVQSCPEPRAEKPPTALDDFEQRNREVAITEFLLPTAPVDFDWNHAKRFTQFFAENLHWISTLYSTLRVQQCDAIKAESQLEQAILRHDLVYADLADDLKRNQDTTNAGETTVTALHTQDSSLANSFKQAIRGSKAVTAPLANMLWPSRNASIRKREKHLRSKMSDVNTKTQQAGEDLQNSRKQTDIIRKRMEDADRKLLNASSSSTKANDALRQTRIEINNAILEVLESDTRVQSTEHLDALAINSPYEPAFRQCVTELHQHQVEHSLLKKELSELQSPLNHDTQQLSQATDEIASAVSKGFVHHPRQRQLKTEIACKVAFRTAPVSTSSTVRLDGKAEGNAALSLNYKIDEIDWQGGEQLRASITQFNKAVSNVGNLQALHAIRSVEAASAAHAILDCISFIRMELERDFGGTK